MRSVLLNFLQVLKSSYYCNSYLSKISIHPLYFQFYFKYVSLFDFHLLRFKIIKNTDIKHHKSKRCPQTRLYDLYLAVFILITFENYKSNVIIVFDVGQILDSRFITDNCSLIIIFIYCRIPSFFGYKHHILFSVFTLPV